MLLLALAISSLRKGWWDYVQAYPEYSAQRTRSSSGSSLTRHVFFKHQSRTSRWRHGRLLCTTPTNVVARGRRIVSCRNSTGLARSCSSCDFCCRWKSCCEVRPSKSATKKHDYFFATTYIHTIISLNNDWWSVFLVIIVENMYALVRFDIMYNNEHNNGWRTFSSCIPSAPRWQEILEARNYVHTPRGYVLEITGFIFAILLYFCWWWVVDNTHHYPFIAAVVVDTTYFLYLLMKCPGISSPPPIEETQLLLLCIRSPCCHHDDMSWVSDWTLIIIVHTTTKIRRWAQSYIIPIF